MELIRSRCCCFTGHRALAAEQRPQIKLRLTAEIERLYSRGVDTFLAGGALGFDTMAAQETLRLREFRLPDLRLVLVLPCLGQESVWNTRDIELYHDLMQRADEVIYTGDEYSREAMLLRNRYLVDHSSYCVCYFRDPESRRGGTAYTVRYAEREGLEIVNLAAR